MKFEPKNFTHLTNIGKISNSSMELHLKLYAGYVTNVNLILEKLETVAPGPEFSELHRRLAWEWNGMRLHEKFFGSLKNTSNTEDSWARFAESSLGLEIISKFGSIDSWKSDFYNIAKIRGFGWTMLVRDEVTGSIMNTWIGEHDVGHLADCKIIMLADVLEHAYINDFGTDRAAYLDSVFEHLDLSVISDK